VADEVGPPVTVLVDVDVVPAVTVCFYGVLVPVAIAVGVDIDLVLAHAARKPLVLDG
jgi:hypothetical protein